MIDKIYLKDFNFKDLLKLSPKDYYLKKSLMFQSGANWTCVPFKTDFDRLVLITNEDNSIRTTTKLPVKSVTTGDDHDLLLLKFTKDKENLKLKLITLVKDFFSIDNDDYSLNDNILSHFTNGVIIGKDTFIPNMQLMLEDLYIYLTNLPDDNQSYEDIDLINKCHLLIYAIRNIFSKNDFIYYPLFVSSKESKKYQKLISSLSKVLINDRFNNSMMEYCLLIRNQYLTKSKKYHHLFVDFYKFFVTLGLELNNAYNTVCFFKNVTGQEKFNNFDILYLSNGVRLARDITIMTAILTNIEFEGTKFDIPHWNNRIFGKGYKLFQKNKLDPVKVIENTDVYDIAKFTIEFNKMIDQRMNLNQKFHN